MTSEEMIQVGRWPEGLPRTYAELYEQQGAFIAHLLRRYNAVDRDIRDLFQHVWMCLQSSDVLVKYAEALGSEPPEWVTPEEGAAFLDVTEDIFLAVCMKAKIARRGKDLWAFEPVVRLSEEDPRFKNVVRELPTPKASRKHFQGYLTRAVRNHFINYCRTRTRKHKERPGDDFAALAPQKRDGELLRRTSWEDNLADPSLSPEGQMDLREKLTRVAPALLKIGAESVGADLRTTVLELTRRREETAKLEACRRGSVPPVEPVSVAEAAGHCILSDLEDGYSLREAVNRLDVTAAMKKTILRTIRLA
jgi:DNA-directed RNA polymerase specialized sigma24 family protein